MEHRFHHVIYMYIFILNLSFYYCACNVIVIVHVTFVLLIALFSRFGYYYLNKHLLTE